MHVLVECSMLQCVRHGYILRLKDILTYENSDFIATSYIVDSEKLTQIILDSSVYGARGGIRLDEAFILERVSRSLSYSLHMHKNEILGLKI